MAGRTPGTRPALAVARWWGAALGALAQSPQTPRLLWPPGAIGSNVRLAPLAGLAGAPAPDDAQRLFFGEAWRPRPAAGITAAIARAGAASRAEASKRLSQRIAGVLGVEPSRWSAIEPKGFARFAPILAQIDDLALWTHLARRLCQCARHRHRPLRQPRARRRGGDAVGTRGGASALLVG